jgi:hypothetical protein
MGKQDDLEKLDTPVGEKEVERKKLECKPVTVKDIEIRKINENLSEKVVLIVKHPDKEETIEISSVKHLVGDSLKDVGTWYKLDEDGKIQKGSGIADLLRHYAVFTLKELIDKELDTCENKSGYLCVKAY